jgi:dTDP-4-dehydrorhamnose reductase
MKILITGANGLLGQKLVSLLSHEKEVKVVATSKGENVNYYDLPEYHFCPLVTTDKKQVIRVIEEEKPEVIIHTAAMTHVDECEQQKEMCWHVNVVAIEWDLPKSSTASGASNFCEIWFHSSFYDKNW